MKRRYIAILIIGLATWLCACETEMMGYEGESGIYFMMQKPPASGYGDPEQYEYVDTTLTLSRCSRPRIPCCRSG